MKLIILDNFKQLRDFEKLISNLKNYLLVSTNGGISEYLLKNKYKFVNFEIKKTLEAQNKNERKINIYFYKYLVGLENFLKKKKFINIKVQSDLIKLNMYHFQFAIHEHNTRFNIYSNIIKKYKNKIKKVYIFDKLSSIFYTDQYQYNPWIMSLKKKFKKKIQICPVVLSASTSESLNFKTKIHDKTYEMINSVKNKLFDSKLNFLIDKKIFYDVKKFSWNKKVTLNILKQKEIERDISYHWNKTYYGERNLVDKKRFQISIKKEDLKFEFLYHEYNKKNKILIKNINDISGNEVLIDLKKHIKNFFINFPKIYEINYNSIKDYLISKKINKYLVYSSVNWLVKLTSVLCRKLKIPVISIQHGGGYGTHHYIKNEYNDFHFSDIFLSYGKFFQKEKKNLLKFNTKVIPIGNIHLSEIYHKYKNNYKNTNSKISKILFISDGNSNNIVSSSKRKQDDYSIYKKQKFLLDKISKNLNLNITYRPFSNSDNLGIVEHIKKNKLNIEINNKDSIYKQILENDLVITDSSAGTVISQILVFEKKLLFISFNKSSFMRKKYFDVLKKSCAVCKNTNDLKKFSENIFKGDFSNFQKIDTKYYKKKYLIISKKFSLEKYLNV